MRFDPESTGEMVAAIEAVACDDEFRARAAVAGPEQARKFDWLEAARATLRAMSNSEGAVAPTRREADGRVCSRFRVWHGAITRIW